MRVAFLVAGHGPPVVVLPWHQSHIGRRWSLELGSWSRHLAEHFQVTTYDSRGQGLSTRDLDREPTMAELRMDLEAVLQAAKLDHAVLVAYGGFAHLALRYAIDNPDRVDALVLVCTCESFSAWPLAGMITLAEENWDLFVDLLTAKLPPDFKERAVAYIKAAATAEDYVRLVRAFSSSSVTDLLGQVRHPALILHSLDQHWLSVDEGTRFAAKVEGARLVFLDGDVEPNDVEGTRAIRSFIAELGIGRLGTDALPIGSEAVDGRLTERQVEVLRLIASGKTNREIAGTLVLSERTVERHIADVYAKIGARNRVEATTFALRAFAAG